MPDIGYADHASIALTQPAPSARGRRALLAAIVAAAAAVGALATGHQAASQAIAQSGAELTRLLRAMAGMKAMGRLLEGVIARRRRKEDLLF